MRKFKSVLLLAVLLAGACAHAIDVTRQVAVSVFDSQMSAWAAFDAYDTEKYKSVMAKQQAGDYAGAKLEAEDWLPKRAEAMKRFENMWKATEALAHCIKLVETGVAKETELAKYAGDASKALASLLDFLRTIGVKV